METAECQEDDIVGTVEGQDDITVGTVEGPDDVTVVTVEGPDDVTEGTVEGPDDVLVEIEGTGTTVGHGDITVDTADDQPESSRRGRPDVSSNNDRVV